MSETTGDILPPFTFEVGELFTAAKINNYLLKSKLKPETVKAAHFTEDAVSYLIKKAFASIYKVGDYFITQNDENPAVRFGGQWELVKDRFLVGAGGELEVLAEGGEKEHTLTVDEMPKHTHGANYSDGGGKYCQAWRKDWGANSGDGQAGHTDEFVDNTGGDQPHNNMPPYKAVYIWVKISDEDEE